jgi:hypothetical protein
VIAEYMVFQHGFSSEDAGGIRNWGTLTLEHSILQSNAHGGGVENYGVLVVRWSTVRDNTGPGIYNYYNAGALTVENSTISNNTSSGVFIFGSDASIVNTTISGNNKILVADRVGVAPPCRLTEEPLRA